MDKIKVNLDMEYERKEITVQDKNGNNIIIFDWVPFSEKEELVQELINMTIAADDEQGVCYDLMNYDLFYNFEMVKHYTNIDVSNVEDIDGFRKLYDYCQYIGLTAYWDCDKNDFMASELSAVNSMIWKYRESIETLYEKQHSLEQIVKKLLSIEPDTENAETRELIEKLIDMKGAFLEKQNQEEILFANKKKPSNVKTGGAVINLARR